MRLLLTAALLGLNLGMVSAQPIFDYLARADPSFQWKQVREKALGTGSLISLQMTSQVWQGITWQHRIAIVRPAQNRHPDLCLLLITGGNPEGAELSIAGMLANLVGMPIAVLGDIPNQPLFDGLHEDGLIAYTFMKFLETKDPTWPALFPMTKASVRAMDAIQALSEQSWGTKVQGFVVTGGSKRGWTTWFCGVTDKRVRAIMPMVYDNLNLPAQMKHQLAQWGKFSEQIDDYTKHGLPDLLTTEEGRELGAMVDPYTYRDGATMPKLIVGGTNDRYWPLDATSDYWKDLVGPKYILRVPNSGHGLQDRVRTISGLAGFTMAVAGDVPLPKMGWSFAPADAGGTALTAKSDPAPRQVLLWSTTAPTTDFRDATWVSRPLEAQVGAYSFTQPKPEKGFAAFFFEFDFTARGMNFPLSTELRIVGG